MIWGGGSDYSVTPYPARYGLWASVARETLAGTYGKTPFGMAESIDIRTALKSYTIWAARQLFLENEVGSLEVGQAGRHRRLGPQPLHGADRADLRICAVR